MSLIFDNLSATLISIAVVFMLVIMQQRVQRVSAEQVMMYAANQNVLGFGEWLEDDLVNIGWGVVGSNGIGTIQQNDTIPDLTKTFSFDRFLHSDSLVTSNVVYTVIRALDSKGVPVFQEIDGADVPLWQVRRIVAGAITGESAPYVTHFNIELENSFGEDVFDVSLAEQLSIQVGMAMPFGEDAYIPETYWGTTFSLLSTN